MGDSADNYTIKTHKLRGTGAGSNDYHINRHLGNSSIDTTSQGFNQGDWAELRDACISGTDAAVDAAGEAAAGSQWWDVHVAGVTGGRAALRQEISDMCA